MNKQVIALAVVLLLIVSGVFIYVYNPSNKPTPPVNCRADPLNGVYHPSRLTINNPCLTVTGQVISVRNEKDGDIHIALDVADKSLLNQANIDKFHGKLVVEVIPIDQCSVNQHNGCLDKPKIGYYYAMTGAYVLDTIHGWMEVHPVWNMTELSSGKVTTENYEYPDVDD